jgi:hypothetical protein
MVLEFSNSVEHTPCSKEKRNFSQNEVEQILFRLMQEKGLDQDQIDQTADGLIVFNGKPDMKIHTVMLEAEKLGLSVKYTKKTVIEVC